MLALATYSTGDVMLFGCLVILCILLALALFRFWHP